MNCITVKYNLVNKNSSGLICGYASVFDITDDHSDIIKKGAFSNVIKDNVKLLWQHNSHEPIGYIKDLKEDKYGLYVEAQLLLDVQKAKEAYALIKSNAIKGLSIGFTPVSYFIDDKNYNRIIQEIDLWEISLVTFPANVYAGITSYKDLSYETLSYALERAYFQLTN